jgi:hypothetical protein
MTQRRIRDGLRTDELDRKDRDELPDREAMSLIATNIAVPANAAAALYVLSDDSTAVADADTSIEIQQTK